jgi:hypothetical protein
MKSESLKSKSDKFVGNTLSLPTRQALKMPGGGFFAKVMLIDEIKKGHLEESIDIIKYTRDSIEISLYDIVTAALMPNGDDCQEWVSEEAGCAQNAAHTGRFTLMAPDDFYKLLIAINEAKIMNTKIATVMDVSTAVFSPYCQTIFKEKYAKCLDKLKEIIGKETIEKTGLHIAMTWLECNSGGSIGYSIKKNLNDHIAFRGFRNEFFRPLSFLRAIECVNESKTKTMVKQRFLDCVYVVDLHATSKDEDAIRMVEILLPYVVERYKKLGNPISVKKFTIAEGLIQKSLLMEESRVVVLTEKKKRTSI